MFCLNSRAPNYIQFYSITNCFGVTGHFEIHAVNYPFSNITGTNVLVAPSPTFNLCHYVTHIWHATDHFERSTKPPKNYVKDCEAIGNR